MALPYGTSPGRGKLEANRQDLQIYGVTTDCIKNSCVEKTSELPTDCPFNISSAVFRHLFEMEDASICLNNQVYMPSIGLGTYRASAFDVMDAVLWASQAGLRLIDTASIYRVGLAHCTMLCTVVYSSIEID